MKSRLLWLTFFLGCAYLNAVSLRASDNSALLANAIMDALGTRQLQSNTLFHIGCYEEPSKEEQTLRSLSSGETKESCIVKCDTPFFAISSRTPNVCLCLPRAGSALQRDGKTLRRNFGECALTSSDVEGLVDVYFQPIVSALDDSRCNSQVLAIRSKMTDERNAPPSFDLVTGKLKPTIFAPYPSGCGTNMWAIQSGTQGQISELQTETRFVKDFASERQLAVSAAIENSLSIGVPGFGFSGSLSASTEVNAVLSQQSSSIDETKIIEANAHLFIANIVIPPSTKHFVTFQGTGSSGFLGRIVDYHKGGLRESDGIKILEDFGQMAVTKASYGGYFQRKSRYETSFQSQTLMSDIEIEACFAAAAEGNGVFRGVELGGGTAVDACSSSAQETLFSSSQELIQQEDTESFIGGSVSGGEFIVTAESSQLLVKPELYAPDDGPKIELLADFFHRDVVSPVSCSRALLTEEQFHEVHLALRSLTLQLFAAVDAELANCECSNFGVKRLKEFTFGNTLSSSKIVCDCIEPVGNAFKCAQSGGVLSSSGSICCPAGCGTCGGIGCERRPGGANNCCERNILFADGNLCENKAPPCKFELNEEDVVNAFATSVNFAANCLVNIHPRQHNKDEWQAIRKTMSEIVSGNVENRNDLNNELNKFLSILSRTSPRRSNKEEWARIRSAASRAQSSCNAQDYEKCLDTIINQLKATQPRRDNKQEWDAIRRCLNSPILEF